MLPRHLSGNRPTGLIPGETIAQFEIGALKNFAYLLIDWETLSCAAIDLPADLSPVRTAIQEHGLRPVAAFLTHTHHDHIGGLGEWIKTFPKLPLFVHNGDLHRIPEKTRNTAEILCIEDGQKIPMGKFTVEVLHTPGHSPGECSYFVDGSPPYLFSGDTVFIRDCGRTDFAGGSTVEMFDSLQRIKTLPPNTVILCGHHYQPECASELSTELVESPPFRCRTVAELEALP